LGGVGKTQITARHARLVWSDPSVDVAVWITATSRDAVVTGYADTARRLLLAGDDVEPERAARALLEWLEATDRRGLIVLDDLTRPADLRKPTNLWPPHDRTGQLLVTTRRQDAAVIRRDWEVVEVGVFSPAESLAYLQERLPDVVTEEEIGQLKGLAEDLGHLPSALAQAAFIADKPLLTPTAYRARLADRRRALAEVMPDDESLPDGHRATVATTWSLSIALADDLHPTGLARPLLEIAALLRPRRHPHRGAHRHGGVPVPGRSGRSTGGRRGGGRRPGMPQTTEPDQLGPHPAGTRGPGPRPGSSGPPATRYPPTACPSRPGRPVTPWRKSGRPGNRRPHGAVPHRSQSGADRAGRSSGRPLPPTPRRPPPTSGDQPPRHVDHTQQPGLPGQNAPD
jgi:hypothetical protein